VNPLQAVARLSQALFGSTDPAVLTEAALQAAIVEIGAESGSLLLADPASSTLVFRCSLGAHPVPSGTTIPWDRGIAGAVYQSGKAEIVREVKADPSHLATIDDHLGHVTRDLLAVPIKSWSGEPIGVMSLLNHQGAGFSEADQDLLVVLGALTAVALQQAARYEDARLADLARTLGDVSHDLKNLLTPVVSSAGLLGEELDDLFAKNPQLESSAELCKESIDLIRRTSARIQHRVKDLADCVKGRSSAPVFAACALGALVSDVIATLRPVAESEGVRLVFDGFDGTIDADERRLYNALYNLVINAIPEVPRGGTVTVRASIIGRGVAIEVVDTGRGMSEAVRAGLFGRDVTSTKSGGTGLGLRIVKDVIDAHGGTIAVTSAIDQGTTFRLEIPHRD